jgi:predicted O-methyltransferase YrrM
MQLSPEAQCVLTDFNTRNERETELQQSLGPVNGMARRDEFLLPVGEAVGQFLHTLILARNAQCIVEVGTSYGYSTLFLADAARLTGGRLISIELDAQKQQSARESLQQAQLAEHVDWRTGDALNILTTIDTTIDLVLIDLWKELYIPCLEILYPKLAHRGIIVADNMLIPDVFRPDAQRYQHQVRNYPDIIDSQLLELGSGIEVSCCWRPDSHS